MHRAALVHQHLALVRTRPDRRRSLDLGNGFVFRLVKSRITPRIGRNHQIRWLLRPSEFLAQNGFVRHIVVKCGVLKQRDGCSANWRLVLPRDRGPCRVDQALACVLRTFPAPRSARAPTDLSRLFDVAPFWPAPRTGQPEIRRLRACLSINYALCRIIWPDYFAINCEKIPGRSGCGDAATGLAIVMAIDDAAGEPYCHTMNSSPAHSSNPMTSLFVVAGLFVPPPGRTLEPSPFTFRRPCQVPIRFVN